MHPKNYRYHIPQIPKKRYDMLVERIGKLYDIDTSEKAKSSYKLVRGTYTDDNIQTLEYPFAFEIIAIPIKGPFQECY